MLEEGDQFSPLRRQVLRPVEVDVDRPTWATVEHAVAESSDQAEPGPGGLRCHQLSDQCLQPFSHVMSLVHGGYGFVGKKITNMF